MTDTTIKEALEDTTPLELTPKEAKIIRIVRACKPSTRAGIEEIIKSLILVENRITRAELERSIEE